ncbi:MAG: hypothetical protein RLZZ535_88 [Cyanobacteriota bacterium]|jgi:uncharacterized protein YqiB (DUF1249 family)
MSNKKIPNQDTRVRHLAKMRELNKRMDQHIVDLDELNALLEENWRKQRRSILAQQTVTSSNE